MTTRAQWLVWGRPGAKLKKPYRAPTLKPASSTNPATWAALAVAAETAAQRSCRGIGYAFRPDGHQWFLDVDHCLVDGEIDPDLLPLLDRYGLRDTYGEMGQSRTGVHCLFAGDLPFGGTVKRLGAWKVELYARGRYCATTGYRLPWSAPDLRPLPEAALRAFLAALEPLSGVARPRGSPTARRPRRDGTPLPADLPPAEVLRAALPPSGRTDANVSFLLTNRGDAHPTAARLWYRHPDAIPKTTHADGSVWPDFSSAEAALVTRCVLVAGRDAGQVLRLMFASHLATRERIAKWNRPDPPSAAYVHWWGGFRPERTTWLQNLIAAQMLHLALDPATVIHPVKARPKRPPRPRPDHATEVWLTLREARAALTEADLRRRLHLGQVALRTALDDLLARDLIARSGPGTRSGPYRYRRLTLLRDPR